MGSKTSIEWDLGFIKQLETGVLEAVANFIVCLFSLIVEIPVRVSRFESKSDNLGAMNLDMRLDAESYYLWLRYSQEINEEGSRYRKLFDYGTLLPEGITLSLDVNLLESGLAFIFLEGIYVDVLFQIGELLKGYSDAVKPKDSYSSQLTGLKRLSHVLSKERDPYIEWHDGPDYASVESAVQSLGPEEKPEAEADVLGRLSRYYDFYVGYAAALIGTERCRTALESLLERESKQYPTTAARIAEHLLIIGKNDMAFDVLRRIIDSQDFSEFLWGKWDPKSFHIYRIEALCCLETAVDKSGYSRPISEFLPRELVESIMKAVCDDHYLVRFHATELLLHSGGIRKSLYRFTELFSLISGTYGSEHPDLKDREGFRKALHIIKEMISYPVNVYPFS